MNPNTTRAITKLPSSIDVQHANLTPRVISDYQKFKKLQDSLSKDKNEAVPMVKKIKLRDPNSEKKID